MIRGQKLTADEAHVEIRQPGATKSIRLDEPYVKEPAEYIPRKIELGADEYFMMGDNRNNSNDSRAWGPLKRSRIIGRAEILFFSTNGGAKLWEPWRWFGAIRWDRLFRPIE